MEELFVSLRYYRGVEEIARFLGLTPRTVRRYLQEGKLPAKKAPEGEWVLCNRDYYLSLGEKKKKVK